MKITNYESPKVRVIENFVNDDLCEFIIRYANSNELWSFSNAVKSMFQDNNHYKAVSKQWDDRKIELNDVVSKQLHQNLIEKIWSVKEKGKRQVEDFFYQNNTPVFLESWELVRWFYPFSQGAHLDYIDPGFNREKDWPVGVGQEVFPPEVEEIYKNHCTTKHFTSMLYLNEDFEGGELYFPYHDNFTIKPKKGMLVIFSGGIENPHGVTQITDGTRYVHTAFWSRTPEKAPFITKSILENTLVKYWEDKGLEK